MESRKPLYEIFNEIHSADGRLCAEIDGFNRVVKGIKHSPHTSSKYWSSQALALLPDDAKSYTFHADKAKKDAVTKFENNPYVAKSLKSDGHSIPRQLDRLIDQQTTPLFPRSKSNGDLSDIEAMGDLVGDSPSLRSSAPTWFHSAVGAGMVLGYWTGISINMFNEMYDNSGEASSLSDLIIGGSIIPLTLVGGAIGWALNSTLGQKLRYLTKRERAKIVQEEIYSVRGPEIGVVEFKG